MNHNEYMESDKSFTPTFEISPSKIDAYTKIYTNLRLPESLIEKLDCGGFYKNIDFVNRNR